MEFTPARKRPKPKNLVQSIQRGAVFLDILSRYPRGLSLGELAQQAQLTKGTTHRILSTLAYLDFVRQDPMTKQYVLGFKLAELGDMVLSQLDLRNIARPFLIDLAERVQETVHLVVRDYDEALYIDKVELNFRQSGLQMISRLGARIPMHCCSVGKVLLAHLPDETVAQIIRSRGLPPRTANTITDPKRLREHLKAVKKKGYAIDDEENEKGIRCTAAPILNGSGKLVAAISISGPTARLSMPHLQNTVSGRVREAALNISKALGFSQTQQPPAARPQAGDRKPANPKGLTD
jgi:IclR family acetate operon transcriptional repressor